MTTEEKFYAALNVINSLPRDGPFQPSPDLLLKFYSYHKQATEGPCNFEKPYFWDSVGRAKWSAWKSLGIMLKEVAMEKYVAELIKIVETMSYSEPVSNFMDLVGPFYETVFIGEPEVKADENQRTSVSENIDGVDAKQHNNKQQQKNMSTCIPNSILEVNEEKEKRLHFVKDFALQSFSHGIIENASFANPLLTVSSNLLLNDIEQMKSSLGENGECERGAVNEISITGGDVICQKTRAIPTRGIPHVSLKEILLLSVISLHHSLEKIIKHLDALEFLIKKGQREERLHTSLPSSPPKSGLRSWSLLLILFWPFVVQWLINVRQRKK